MNYISLCFFIFITAFLILYYLVPVRFRYILIFLGSLVFYGFGNPATLLLLLTTIAITYLGGLWLEKRKTKGVLAVCVIADLALLLVFKYTNFAIDTANVLWSRFGGGENPLLFSSVNLILPVGLSFYIFQSITYLADVYRGRVVAEKNPVLYGAFVAFFPTILSGPIQQARELLPQLRRPGDFNAEQAKKGTILFIWGLFEKLMVANFLLPIITPIYADPGAFSGAYLLIAAVSFSLYIYADFSAYSDMARGIAKVMGIRVGKNFDNPYLSTTTGEFWNRWHMSLNRFFVENVYIPLGGNRKGTVRKYLNVMVVFLLSGLWHGAAWRFVIWGLVNGLLVVIGQLLAPVWKRFFALLHVDEKAESIVFLKRLICFGLITFTWVFFQNDLMASLVICKRICQVQLVNFFDAGLLSITGTQGASFMALLFTLIFLLVQNKRQNEKEAYALYEKQPLLVQLLPLAMILAVCLVGAFYGNTEVNTQFLYFQF